MTDIFTPDDHVYEFSVEIDDMTWELSRDSDATWWAHIDNGVTGMGQQLDPVMSRWLESMFINDETPFTVIPIQTIPA